MAVLRAQGGLPPPGPAPASPDGGKGRVDGAGFWQDQSRGRPPAGEMSAAGLWLPNQPIPFGTPAWKMAYAVRNQIENANKGLKDKNAFRLGWCRALGLAANLLGSIMHMVAYNIDLARKAQTRSP